MVVGETPQISGGVLVIILVVFLLFAAAVIGVVVAGCRWADRAGRGSEQARMRWFAVAVVEGGFVLRGLVGLVTGTGGTFLLTVAAGALGLQSLLYTRAKRGRGPEIHDR
jgi:hypothetical protein